MGGGGGAQGLVDEQFVVAHAVEVAGVEQGDPGVERGVEGGDGLGAVDVGAVPGDMPMQPRPIAETWGPAVPS
ncbi:hypothetical protein SANT12839_034720 [Streptomyces antimycoticus]|uniref:Uncharacterized protein n=1 Tax=Streptomyces antimycoticus TaxID=68175 RepID=A0A4D4K6I0_9ACTN|nr:hypothetical protein SANT12839_034720 [Streptomyces antimycoticus]